MEHTLEAVHRREPGHVLHASEWLGQAPGDDCAVVQFFQVARAGHSGFEKDTNGWCGVDQVSPRLRQFRETIHGNSAAPAASPARWWIAESHRAGHSHGKRLPTLAGKRKRELFQ